MEQEFIPGLPDDVAIDCIARVPLRHHAGIRPVCRRWRDLIASRFFRRQRRRLSAAEDLFFLVQADSITLPLPISQSQEEEESKDVIFEEEERHGSDGDASSKRSDGSPRTPGYGLTVYNVTLNEWRRATPSAVPVPMFAQCAAAGENKIVLAGGWDPTTFEPVAGVHVLDPINGTCRRGKDSPAARSFSAAASISGGSKVLIAGGHDSQKNALKSADVYVPDSDTWQSLPEMFEERDECRGLAAGGKFVAISGYGTENQGRFSFSAELFDCETSQWIKEENFWSEEQQQGSGGAAACFSVEGKIYYIDCSVSDSGRRGVREWVSNGGAWKNFAAVPEGMKTGARAAAVIGDKVFVTAADASGNTAWVFELKKKKWAKIETPVAFSGFIYSAAALRL